VRENRVAFEAGADTLGIHTVRFPYRRDFLGRTGQPDQPRVKLANLFGEHLRRLVLRVDGDQQGLQLLPSIAQVLQHLQHLPERNRANALAAGVTEEDDGESTFEIR
jgi:hypothetical protein